MKMNVIYDELNSCKTSNEVYAVMKKHDISLKMKRRSFYMMDASDDGLYMRYLVDDSYSSGRVKFGNLHRVFSIEKN
jgi:hypothetical protein